MHLESPGAILAVAAIVVIGTALEEPGYEDEDPVFSKKTDTSSLFLQYSSNASMNDCRSIFDIFW